MVGHWCLPANLRQFRVIDTRCKGKLCLSSSLTRRTPRLLFAGMTEARSVLAALIGLLALTGRAGAEDTVPRAHGVGGEPPPAAAASRILTCEGLFGPAATHAKLTEAFGAQNVIYDKQPGAEGETFMATVLFPRKAADRLVIAWKDEKRQSKPESLTARTGAAWHLPNGLKPGSTLAEVEEANGKPFAISGFDWDYGGFVNDWHGGKLAADIGPCTLTVRFDPGKGARTDKVSGDQPFQSSNPAMRAAKPVVSEITLTRK